MKTLSTKSHEGAQRILSFLALCERVTLRTILRGEFNDNEDQ